MLDITENVGGAIVLNDTQAVFDRINVVWNCDFGAVLHDSLGQIHASPIENNTDSCDPELYRGTPKSLQFRTGLANTLLVRLDQVEILDVYTASERGRTTMYYEAKTDYDMAHAFFNMSKVLTSQYDYGAACGGRVVSLVGGGQLNLTGGYNNDLTCRWLINCTSPREVVSAAFTSFRTEQDYDTVALYDGGADSSPLIASRSGITLT